MTTYELLADVCATHGWRLALHYNVDPEPGEDLRMLAVYDRKLRDEFAELLEAMVVVEMDDGLEYAAQMILRGLIRAGLVGQA